jgi:hypothetical protein
MTKHGSIIMVPVCRAPVNTLLAPACISTFEILEPE